MVFDKGSPVMLSCRHSRRRGYEDRHTFDVLTIEAFAILAEHVGGEAFAIEFETF